MSKNSHKFRVWRGFPWFMVDSRGHVRACIRRCFRNEAEAFAQAMFSEPMRAYRRTDLTTPQRMESIAFPALTPIAIKALGIDIASCIDMEQRNAKKAALRAKVVPGRLQAREVQHEAR